MTQKLSERVMEDKEKMYCDYVYVADGEVIVQSEWFETTVFDYKRRKGVKEVTTCDLFGRGILGAKD